MIFSTQLKQIQLNNLTNDVNLINSIDWIENSQSHFWQYSDLVMELMELTVSLTTLINILM